MFNNIGDKLKAVAEIFCWIGIICSVILGIISMSVSFFSGLIIIVGGSLGSWLSSLAFYGFGELIERAASIDDKLGYGEPTATVNNTWQHAPTYPPVSSTTAAPTSASVAPAASDAVYIGTCSICQKSGVAIKKVTVDGELKSVCQACIEANNLE